MNSLTLPYVERAQQNRAVVDELLLDTLTAFAHLHAHIASLLDSANPPASLPVDADTATIDQVE